MHVVTGQHMDFPLGWWGILPHHGGRAMPHSAVDDHRYHWEDVLGDDDSFYEDAPGTDLS